MKHYLLLILSAVFICSCTNRNSVNIIVTNTQQHDIQNVRVDVSVKDISKLLGSVVNHPVVLNEKNNNVPYSMNKSKDTITFFMPIIHKDSQKTFSVNKAMPEMSNSFLRNRESIRISK